MHRWPGPMSTIGLTRLKTQLIQRLSRTARRLHQTFRQRLRILNFTIALIQFPPTTTPTISLPVHQKHEDSQKPTPSAQRIITGCRVTMPKSNNLITDPSQPNAIALLSSLHKYDHLASYPNSSLTLTSSRKHSLQAHLLETPFRLRPIQSFHSPYLPVSLASHASCRRTRQSSRHTPTPLYVKTAAS